MKKFVDIKYFPKNNAQRNIESLSEMYGSDSDEIDVAVRDLMSSRLTVDMIKGKRVLIKPNWVRHSIIESDELCLRANDKVVLAVVKFIANNKPNKIVVGDAPVQGSKWDKALSQCFIDTVEALSAEHGCPIEIKDFRRVIYGVSLDDEQSRKRSIEEYVIFDLGAKSVLEDISQEKGNFRITNYNPDRLSESHYKGVHKYCITNELFASDLVISVPKAKTHQKAGITCALKNLVGINGDKDYLPHHRIGSLQTGGDCYPKYNILRDYSEKILDFANRRVRIGSKIYVNFIRLSALLWRLSKPTKDTNAGAAWWGNDTTWRMVVDLNTIAVYGCGDGQLCEQPQRVLFSLTDGVIGGQGDGPLKPDPLALGLLMFTNDSYLNDLCLAEIMGFSADKINLLSYTKGVVDINNSTISINGIEAAFAELKKLKIKTIPPPGWIKHLQDENSNS